MAPDSTASQPVGSSEPHLDPVAHFLANPNSHLTDILYLYFRFYKRRLLERFFERALQGRRPNDGSCLEIADVGAAMGHDLHYLLNLYTNGFSRLPAWGGTSVSLVEGDEAYIAAGESEWNPIPAETGIAYRYVRADLARDLPLAENSCDVIICSEVVEHLEEPVRLLEAIRRSLKPGGYLLFTTDNSPSFFQHVRRIPVWIRGRYRRAYERPKKGDTIVSEVNHVGGTAPIYGHINLNPTRYWETCCRQAGLEVAAFGTYESIRRGGGSKTPAALAAYFLGGFLVSLLPVRLGRFFGDTTALLLRKPQA